MLEDSKRNITGISTSVMNIEKNILEKNKEYFKRYSY